ncbi:MAG: hypothetical protein JWP22_1371 [Ramlibacter sp.]|jgi:hypothetical protein|nr:hypothetical protein [Ramlibacter sp.]
MSRYLFGPAVLLAMANKAPNVIAWISANKVVAKDCILSDLAFAIAKATVAEQAQDIREHDAWIKLLDALYARLQADGASVYNNIDEKVLTRYAQWRNLKPLEYQTATGPIPLAQDLRLLIATADVHLDTYTELASPYLQQAAQRGVSVCAIP